jgi:hypothetical protein
MDNGQWTIDNGYRPFARICIRCVEWHGLQIRAGGVCPIIFPCPWIFVLILKILSRYEQIPVIVNFLVQCIFIRSLDQIA